LGLEEAIRADPRNARTAEVRIDNLRDVVGTIARYERRVWAEAAELIRAEAEGASDPATTAAVDPPAGEDEAWAPPTLAEAMARMALADLDERDDDDPEDRGSVALMTLHSAKGLEFPEGFIVGLEEELLPHARSLEDAADPERVNRTDPLAEERRLFYVGITRARNRLTLSLCRARRRGGELVPRQPSRFLSDIPAELLNVKSADEILSPEESESLRKDFFARMREMLGAEDDGEDGGDEG